MKSRVETEMSDPDPSPLVAFCPKQEANALATAAPKCPLYQDSIIKRVTCAKTTQKCAMFYNC